MKRLYRYIFLVLIPTFLLAQSSVKISGKVSDAETGRPLTGANIIVNGTNIGAVTDISGEFFIENLLTGTYTITVSYIGYTLDKISDVTVRTGIPARLSIQLIPVVLPLKGVTVTSTRYTSKLTEDKKVITQKQIETSGAANLPDLFRHIQGVTIQSGNSSTISIRGSLPQHILILIDGVHLINNLTGITDITDIPLNIIDHIEIYKSGASWKFGSGAIGGAVNIITKDASNSGVNISLSASPFFTYAAAFNAGKKYRNFKYFISGKHEYSKNNFPYSYTLADSTFISKTRKNNNITNDNIFLKASYNHSGNNITISSFYNHSNRGLPGKIFSLTPYARVDQNSTKTDIIYKFIGKSTIFNTNFFILNRVSKNKNIIPDNAPIEYRRYLSYHYKNSMQTIGSNTKFDFSPVPEFISIQTGLNLKYLSFSDQNLLYLSTGNKNNSTDKSLSTFGTIEINKHFLNSIKASLHSSVHYDLFYMKNASTERKENKISPSSGVSLTYGKSTKFFSRAILSRSFRVPSFADLFYQDFRIQGKPDLLPEIGNNILFGGGALISVNGISAKCDASYFNNNIDNLIVWRLGSFEVFRPYNTDAEIKGTEFNFDIKSGNIHLTLSQTNVKPIQKNGNITTTYKILPYRAQKLLKSSIRISEPWLRTSLFYQYVGTRYVNEANTVAILPYSILDITFEKNFEVLKYNLRSIFSIYNLLNKEYQTVRDMPVKGRYWNLSLTIKL